MTIAIAASKAGWSSFFDADGNRRPAKRAAGFPRTPQRPLTRSLTDGRFALGGSGLVTVAAVPGLAVRARSGSLWITQKNDPRDYLLLAGERFVADRQGLLVVSAFERSELELEWPSDDPDRLSPGLEPLEITA